jgi:prepilin-type N-terminal cleavage/methylation domain-containing protein
MTKNYKRGFTLIELLVVIAIIGILAGIVLAALGNTRQKGADAGIQGNLDTIRTEMEIYASNNNNSYLNACTADTTIANALNGAKNNAGVAGLNTTLATAGTSATTVTCHSSATGWGAESPLKSNSAQNWCVDSTGFAGTTTGTTLAANDTACN